MDADEVRWFESATPAGFDALLPGAPPAPAARVRGLLFLPGGRNAPLPVVVTSIGSLGLASGREAWVYVKA